MSEEKFDGRADRVSPIEANNIRTKQEYDAFVRRSNLPQNRKRALLASPQIPAIDRGFASPLGGIARPAKR